jgi:hypothetical protein
MPRRQGPRRSTDLLFDAQPKDDQADAVILDEASAVQGKCARRRKRGRSVLEVALNLLDGIGSLWP